MKYINMTWALWILLTVVITGYLVYVFNTEEKGIFSPGKLTHGHHQIEMACSSCHSEPLGGAEVMQQACVDCHKEELKQSDDSHPRTKFTDPRNISRVKELDARKCVTCHTEHRTEITKSMGVTIPEDFCFKCHSDVATDRPSHKGMAFSSCASAGCHNYHDNRGLYEDFLEKHLEEPHYLDKRVNKSISPAEEIITSTSYPVNQYPHRKLNRQDVDAQPGIQIDGTVTQEWSITSHAKAGVNCTACHEVKDDEGKISWVEKPAYDVCQTCHKSEVKGFLGGKHGMRLKQGLSPMTPRLARASMKEDAHSKELGCSSCHSAHKFDVKQAAVDACLNCHNDQHSQSFKDSPHFSSWAQETSGQANKNTGVSCATCHMPRVEKETDGKMLILSEHNQNMNLRPNEKMLRSVCMNCHGLGFSINALADKKLIQNNFNGLPKVHVQSIDLVKQRMMKRGKPKEGSP